MAIGISPAALVVTICDHLINDNRLNDIAMTVKEPPKNVHWFEKLEQGEGAETGFTPEKARNIREALQLDKYTVAASRWIHELMVILDQNDPAMAFQALRGVLFGLRDRLNPQLLLRSAIHFPVLIRGLLLEGYQPKSKSDESGDGKGVLLERVSEELSRDINMDPERLFEGVTVLLGRHLPADILDEMGSELPTTLQAVWKEFTRPARDK